MSKLEKPSIKYRVFKKIKPEVVQEIQEYVSNRNPHLWGEQKPELFISDMVLLFLYKDLYQIGYVELAAGIDFHYKISHNSLSYNIKKIRKTASDWADEKIQLGNCHDWKIVMTRQQSSVV